MSKRLRNLKFLNQQVISLISCDSYGQKQRADGLQMLCSITKCDKWHCDECPIQREAEKPENKNG